jgi:hypothetical protein
LQSKAPTAGAATAWIWSEGRWLFVTVIFCFFFFPFFCSSLPMVYVAAWIWSEGRWLLVTVIFASFFPFSVLLFQWCSMCLG